MVLQSLCNHLGNSNLFFILSPEEHVCPQQRLTVSSSDQYTSQFVIHPVYYLIFFMHFYEVFILIFGLFVKYFFEYYSI